MRYLSRLTSVLTGLLVLILQHQVAHAQLRQLPVPDDLKEARAVRSELEEQGWWIQLGECYLSPLPGADREKSRIESYYAAGGLHLPDDLARHSVAYEHGLHILYLPDGAPANIEELADPGCHGFDGRLLPLEPNQRLVWPARQDPPEPEDYSFPDGAILQALDELTEAKYSETINALTEFGQRHTYGSFIDDARDHILAKFDSYGLEASLHAFPMGERTAYNVVGKLTGTRYPEEFYIVGGHYDSRPEPPLPSPGAEDNASGTAGVMELARIVSKLGAQRTIYFVAFSGEEQGLHGSSRYALKLLEEGKDRNFKGAIIMDMIAFDLDGDRGVTLNTDIQPWGSELRDHLVRASMDFTDLSAFVGTYSANSDHAPLLFIGPAVLTIEDDAGRYSCYHQSCDTIDNLDLGMGLEIMKMNLATLLRLANPDEPAQGWYFY